MNRRKNTGRITGPGFNFISEIFDIESLTPICRLLNLWKRPTSVRRRLGDKEDIFSLEKNPSLVWFEEEKEAR